MIIQLLLIIVGLVILVAGAEGLVRGAASLAAKLKISALVIGLTIVSFGTSAPELTVNIASALNGSSDIAIGNIIGSNISNILLILGICAVIRPLRVSSSTVWKEIPLALLAVVLVLVMGNDLLIDGVAFNSITRTDGIVLLSLFAIFMYYIFGISKTEKPKIAEESGDDIKQYGTLLSIGFIIIGMAGLIIGGKLLVGAAVALATVAGLSESLIGLTIVGVGTSLPELATSVMATIKKQQDIAIGNVVGSNIFNVFWILGLTAVLLQLPFNSVVNVDALVACGATVLLFIFMFLGKKHILNRVEGIFFILLYVGYIGYLVQRG
jgi:cation:H+ antiporter